VIDDRGGSGIDSGRGKNIRFFSEAFGIYLLRKEGRNGEVKRKKKSIRSGEMQKRSKDKMLSVPHQVATVYSAYFNVKI
jgi:hypothetical protein